MNDTREARSIALVTGASKGIGAAIARKLAHEGFHIIINYRASVEAASEVVSQIVASGGSADIEQADVTNLTAVREMITRIREKHGRLDVLVNNAGRSEDGFLLLMPHDKWWSLFNDNVAAVVNCTRAALPLLMAVRDRPTAIINISSISGLRGVVGQTGYGAAKAAIVGFTRALAIELAGKNVTVNCVAPGPIDTEMYQHVSDDKKERRLTLMPVGRLGKPEEVAEVVALLAKGNARFLYGQVISIDGGSTT